MVDDSLPTFVRSDPEEKHTLLFARYTVEGDFWTCIFEKMLAKLLGGYTKQVKF